MRLMKIFSIPWWRLAASTLGYIYLYVFMEWLFFATKPSFLSQMGLLQKVALFFLTGFLFYLPVLLALAALFLIGRLLNFELLMKVMAFFPAFVLSSLGLILLDNFTYTIFGVGIVSSAGVWRAVYALMFIVILILLYRQVVRELSSTNLKTGILPGLGLIIKWILLCISIVLSISQLSRSTIQSGTYIPERTDVDLPNIILLGSDGLTADHLSAYGYNRETTPNIFLLKKYALVAENAFPNAGSTGGSLVSMLTSKLPTETRVVFPPDILTGEDAVEHLPGILHKLGYYNVQITVPHYGDAFTLNLQDGFDVANLRSERGEAFWRVGRLVAGSDSVYFAKTILERIGSRLLHIFYVQDMSNPFTLVTQPASQMGEKKRFESLLTLFDQSRRPIFAHVHMMGTHGPRFVAAKQVFSAGKAQNTSWDLDFYDDAILSFDRQVGELFETLSAHRELDNTIIILYSDHGLYWQTNQRVPLMIWFPRNEFAGQLLVNAQNLDITPTILDYLHIPIPGWVSGVSLIQQGLPADRPIFSASTDPSLVERVEAEHNALNVNLLHPPFYQIGSIGLVVCNQWFSLNLTNPELTYGVVQGYSGSCDSINIPSPHQAREMILDHLFINGYDVSDFPRNIPVIAP